MDTCWYQNLLLGKVYAAQDSHEHLRIPCRNQAFSRNKGHDLHSAA